MLGPLNCQSFRYISKGNTPTYSDSRYIEKTKYPTFVFDTYFVTLEMKKIRGYWYCFESTSKSFSRSQVKGANIFFFVVFAIYQPPE